jgi:choline monooxygenase
MPQFEINADIRRASTLPAEFYLDPVMFERSKEAIFARTWQFIAGSDLSNGLTPINLLPDFLDEPLLIAGNNGETVCLSNVCTHRGKVLVEEPCEASLIRCGYHGRRFSLDGKFLSMPEFEEVVGFPSPKDDLARINFAERSGFRFVSLDPVAPFDDFVADAAKHITNLDPGGLKFTGRREYRVNAHWALYCENYLEGFHIPYVHAELNKVVNYGTYTTDTFRYSSLQTGYGDGGSVAARYLFIFPNIMINFYPWGISVNVVRPISPAETAVEFLTYVADDSAVGTGAGGDLDAVELEDEAVVESVQQGIRSRFYDRGRYSPSREQGTHHFHRLIAEFMG